jgi:2-desacetyl-2-hydroxyethyl bacteriochlorophyllide A dehydrogenase
MRAWLWRGGDDQGLVELPDPVPGPDELLIKVAASGMCGTDLRILANDYGHSKPPLVIGHEFSGTVAGYGDAVSGWSVGDRVSADPNIYCLNCEWCARQAYNLCTHVEAVGIVLPGAMAEYVTVPARLAVHLPDSISFGAAALIEPLSCVLHGFERGEVVPDRSMAIYGAGAIGLMALITAVSQGLRVVVVEPHAARRERALSFGAEAALESLADAGDFDYVLDASGAPPAITEGLGHLRKRGTLIQMGVAPRTFTLPYSPYDIYETELRIIGSNSVADCYVRAAELMAEIAPQMTRLITHTLPLERTGEVPSIMAGPDAVKVHVQP